MHKVKIAVAGVAVAVAGLGAAGATSAAADQGPSKTPTVSVSRADGDAVQVGDQTTPDVPGAIDKGEAAEPASGTETAGTELPDKAGKADAGETTKENDGPGGHEDPAGNADHQFDGQE